VIARREVVVEAQREPLADRDRNPLEVGPFAEATIQPHRIVRHIEVPGEIIHRPVLDIVPLDPKRARRGISGTEDLEPKAELLVAVAPDRIRK